ncbi:MAG: hypothetical protein N3D12_06735, partial [Candidatus Methanomethyliaceae archaeon]|nr:hypothetical protein [Candidatus Methanomethyliaceae archaeon]
MREGEGGLGAAVQDVLLGVALAFPLEVGGALVVNNPQLDPLWTTSDLFLIIEYKFLLLMMAIAIIEIMGHWGLMYAVGYLVGAFLMSILLGFDVLNLIMIFLAILVALLIT